MATGLREVNEQLWADMRSQRRRIRIASAEAQPMQLADNLLTLLEDRVIAGDTTITDSLRFKVNHLISSLPAEIRPIFGASLGQPGNVLQLMDVVFDMQEHLLARKLGVAPPGSGDEPGGLDRNASSPDELELLG